MLPDAFATIFSKMASVRNLSIAWQVILLNLLSACGGTVTDIPSLAADLVASPFATTQFALKVKALTSCTPQNRTFYVTDGTNTLWLVNKTDNDFSVNDILRVTGRIRNAGNPNCLSVEVVGKGKPEPIADLTLGRTRLIPNGRSLPFSTAKAPSKSTSCRHKTSSSGCAT